MRKPSLRTLFRVLVVASLLLPLLGVGYEIAVTPSLSEEEQLVLEWAGHDSPLDALLPSEENQSHPLLVWTFGGLSALLLLAMVILQIGLFFFRNWARIGWTVSLILFLPATLGLGWNITLPLAEFADDLAIFMDGIILVLIYTSPLASSFTRTRDDKNSAGTAS